MPLSDGSHSPVNNRVLVTGLMSGSSLDGVDLACSAFSLRNNGWTYELLAAETVPYPPSMLRMLTEAMAMNREELSKLDRTLGRFYAGLLNSFHRRTGLTPELIASHGHTVFHDPSMGLTLQVGDGQVMAERTGTRVVCDFRSEDVAQGGQGAPLVPVGDRLLFGQYGACLNLGGFANLSYDTLDGVRLAYDIGPCNLLLNRIASLDGKLFDPGGSLARLGNVNHLLLDQLNNLDYYALPPPKSLGREWFRDHVLPLIIRPEPGIPDLMATAAEHVAIQAGRAIDLTGAGEVLVTGGGAFNLFLVERLQHYSAARLVIPDKTLIDYKEALVFAFLGLLRILGEINCLSSVTGGMRDLSTGRVHTPGQHNDATHNHPLNHMNP